MIKVQFINKYGKYKKGRITHLSKTVVIHLMRMENMIQITPEVKNAFPGYDILKRNGLDPVKNSYCKSEIVSVLKELENKLRQKKI